MLGRRPALPDREQRLAARNERMAAMVASVKPRASVVGGSTALAVPKPVPYRDRALLDMAQLRPCLLLVPALCNHRLDTTVAAHSNLGIHGKAGARKADDCYSVWACAACHAWLDQGSAPAAQKERAFMAAHLRQVLAWREVAAADGEPQRFQRAALRTLEHLNATPLGDSAP